jgi:hypothetical protein
MSDDTQLSVTAIVEIIDRSFRYDTAVEELRRMLNQRATGSLVTFGLADRRRLHSIYRRRFERVGFSGDSILGSDRLVDDLASVDDDYLGMAMIEGQGLSAIIWLSQDMSRLVGCVAGLVSKITDLE